MSGAISLRLEMDQIMHALLSFSGNAVACCGGRFFSESAENAHAQESACPYPLRTADTSRRRRRMIARIHHRLNSYEGMQTIEFKKFLADFSRDFSAMVSSDERPEQIIVEGSEINLPVATAIPLDFIASELITNAAKYGKSLIIIRLEQDREYGYALSISNDGPALPKGFNPDASKGLGMRIIRSFVRQIGGELRIGRNEDGEGARFTVLFSRRPEEAEVHEG
jgi:two-component sensor histidine kinase